MPSSPTSATVFSRRSPTPSATTTHIIYPWSSTSALRFGCGSYTAQLRPWPPARAASWVRDMLGHSRCWNAWATSPTAYNFRRVPASTTSSTSASSSRSMVHRHRLRRHCLLSSRDVYSTRQNGSCAPNSAVVLGTFSFFGLACPRVRRRGSPWTPCARPSPTSSSRTSCFPREGEMLWSASRMKGGGRDVAKGTARTRAPGARDLRVSLLIPAISSIIVGGDLFPC